MEIGGKKVVDAKSPVMLEITQSDIKKGSNKDPGGCAAALALRRMSGIRAARVHLKCTYLEKSDHWERYMTPESLRNEIITFDRGGSFEPGTFKINRPPKSQRLLGKRTGGADKTDRNKRRKKIAYRPWRHITPHVRHTLAK